MTQCNHSSGLEVRECFCVSASEALGDLDEGQVAVGLTKGQFSFGDMILALQGRCESPPDLDVASWTASPKDLRLIEASGFGDCRFLLDRSYVTRHEEYAEEFVELFGEGSIRVLSNHAKVARIESDDRSFYVSGSMNLNQNKRLENFTVIRDPEPADYIREFFDQVFADQEPGAAFSGSTMSEHDYFQAFQVRGDYRGSGDLSVAVEPEPGDEFDRCQATTSTGDQCQNPASEGRYCWIDSHRAGDQKRHSDARDPMYKPDVVAAAIRKHDGNLSRAAESVGCHRSTVKRYCNDFEVCEKARDEARHSLVDLAEQKTKELVQQRNFKACRFVLNCWGQGRGWTPKEEREHSGDGAQSTMSVSINHHRITEDDVADE